jgi:cation:H+ antiporter
VEFAYAALGLVILLFAGDLLVRGAVNMSLRLGVPALIVSLTVVAFGTSAPELLVSVQAILDGAPGIAVGNVVGSNIANVLLVLGIPAIISALHAVGEDSHASYFKMVAATVLFIVLAWLGPMGVPHALVMLAAMAVVLTIQIRAARAHRDANAGDVVERANPSLRWWRILSYIGVGLVGLPIGASLLIDGAVVIAERLGVSDTVIGLTLVAVGTSLPELATTVVAAVRRQADIAIGNVVGSNIFNLLGIIGITALIAPVPIDPALLRFDLWVMLAAALVLAPFVLLGWTITRGWGWALVALYGAYLWAVVA